VTDSRSANEWKSAARAAARAQPAPIVHGDESVLLLGGAEGADTTGFRARCATARDESALHAGGAEGAGTAGSHASGDGPTCHSGERSERLRATEGRARAEGAFVVVVRADARAEGERVGANASGRAGRSQTLPLP
jgi:hypothetical protein